MTPYAMIDREAPVGKPAQPYTPPPKTPLQAATEQAIRQTPPGYMLTDVQPVETSQFPARGGREQPGPVRYQAIYTPRPTEPEYIMYSGDPYFGFTIVEPYKDAPKEIREKAVIVSTLNPEEKPALGLGVATTAAVGVGVPVLGAVSAGAVGVAEGVKYGVTRQHLTVEEAVNVAALSQVAGYTAMRYGPAVKQSFSSLANRLSPERALYNRVVMEANAPKVAQEPSVGLVERITTRVSPERALYNRVVKGAQVKDVLGGDGRSEFVYKAPGGSGGGFAQQVLVRQAPVVKAPMKNFAVMQTVPRELFVVPESPVVKSMTPKTVAKQATVQMVQQREMARTVQQQVQNPFTAYQGKPYYRQREREEYELLVYSYPQARITAALIPETTVSPVVAPSQRLSPQQAQFMVQQQMFAQTQLPFTTQVPRQQQIQQQQMRQVQQLAPLQKTATTTVTTTKPPNLLDLRSFDLPGFKKDRPVKSAWYRQFERRNPVLGGRELLRAYAPQTAKRRRKQ